MLVLCYGQVLFLMLLLADVSLFLECQIFSSLKCSSSHTFPQHHWHDLRRCVKISLSFSTGKMFDLTPSWIIRTVAALLTSSCWQGGRWGLSFVNYRPMGVSRAIVRGYWHGLWWRDRREWGKGWKKIVDVRYPLNSYVRLAFSMFRNSCWAPASGARRTHTHTH